MHLGFEKCEADKKLDKVWKRGKPKTVIEWLRRHSLVRVESVIEFSKVIGVGNKAVLEDFNANNFQKLTWMVNKYETELSKN